MRVALFCALLCPLAISGGAAKVVSGGAAVGMGSNAKVVGMGVTKGMGKSAAAGGVVKGMGKSNADAAEGGAAKAMGMGVGMGKAAIQLGSKVHVKKGCAARRQPATATAKVEATGEWIVELSDGSLTRFAEHCLEPVKPAKSREALKQENDKLRELISLLDSSSDADYYTDANLGLRDRLGSRLDTVRAAEEEAEEEDGFEGALPRPLPVRVLPPPPVQHYAPLGQYGLPQAAPLAAYPRFETQGPQPAAPPAPAPPIFESPPLLQTVGAYNVAPYFQEPTTGGAYNAPVYFQEPTTAGAHNVPYYFQEPTDFQEPVYFQDPYAAASVNYESR